MTHLHELAQLVGPTYHIPQTDESQDTTLAEFLQLVRQPGTDLPSAAAALGLDPADPAFRKLKHRLKFYLLNEATALDPADRNSDVRDRRYAYVWKLIAVGKQLRKRLDSDILLAYLEEAFRISEEADFLEAAYVSATMLRRQYTNRRYDAEKYVYYRDQAAYYRRAVQDYQDVVADLNEVYYLRNAQASEADILKVADDAYRRRCRLLERYEQPIICYLVYLLELNPYLITNDYAGVVAVAERALRYLDGREDTLPVMYQVFEANLSVAYTQLNDYEKGMAFARRLLQKTEPEEHNYIKVYELMLILSLRGRKYQEAYRIYRSIDGQTLRSDLATYYRETFRIIEAYLYLLVRMGRVVPEATDDAFTRFRVKRFINSFEHAGLEKSHRNVHLLIIELVDQLLNRQHRRTAHSIEAITKYGRRHLNEPGRERIRYFLRALAQLSEQRFHRAAVQRHSEWYIKSIARYPIEESKLDYYMELIPYDELWGMLLEQLGFERVRMRGR